MSIGHKIRHWKETFQGNSAWFEPEMRLKMTLKFGKKTFVEIFAHNFLHEMMLEATWQAISKFKNKNIIAKGGKFSKKKINCRKSKKLFVFFFFENISFGFKLLCRFTVFVFQTELFIACHFCFQLVRPSNTSNIFL